MLEIHLVLPQGISLLLSKIRKRFDENEDFSLPHCNVKCVKKKDVAAVTVDSFLKTSNELNDDATREEDKR